VVLRRFVIACALAAFVPLLVPLATGTVFTQFDLQWFNLPQRYLYRQALATGGSIFWTPALFSGLYVLGEGQTGVAHPWHLALYSTLPLDVAANLEIIASYVFAVAGMYCLLRRFACSVEAATLGAISWAFSGFNLLHLSHVNAIAVIAHMPWILLAADKVVAPAGPRDQTIGFTAVALLFGSQVLLGFPQAVWLTVLMLGPFSLWRTFRPSRLALVAAASAIGVGLGAVQLLPTLEAVRESERAAGRVAFAVSYSLHPLNLIQLVSPYVFRLRAYASSDLMAHEFAIYDGAFATAAVVWSAIRWREWRDDRRRLAAALLVLAALAAVLSLGSYGGLYYVFTYLPVVSGFRAPTRHIVLVHFALAALAAVGFDDLVDIARRRNGPPLARLWAFGALIAAALGLFLVPRGAWTTSAETPPAFVILPTWQIAVGTAVVVAIFVAVVLAARGTRWAPHALVALTVFDVGLWGYTYVWQPAPEPLAALRRRARPPVPIVPGGTFYSYVPYEEAPALMLGYRISNGYVGLFPERRMPDNDATVQRLAGVRWARTPRGWSEIPSPMPRVRLVSAARVTADPAADLKSIDIERTALVDAQVGPLSGSPGVARLERDDAGRIRVNVFAEGRQLLVIAERFHEGWHATADGRAAPLVRTNGDFMGCVIEPGVRQIDLWFDPSSARIGLAGTALSAAVLVLSTFALYRRERQRPAAAARVAAAQ
jgi:hypothetical protein